jgi:hypothetical protein
MSAYFLKSFLHISVAFSRKHPAILSNSEKIALFAGRNQIFVVLFWRKKVTENVADFFM